MQKTKTLKILIILCGIVILELAVFVLFFMNIKKNVQESYMLKNQGESARTLEDQNRNLKQFLADNTSSIEFLNQAIISKDGAAAFIDSIEALAQESGVSIQTNTVELVEPAPEEGAVYEHLKLSISIQGSWDKVYTFIHLLEALPHKSSITAVSINQSTYTNENNPDAQSESIWKGAITFETLKQK